MLKKLQEYKCGDNAAYEDLESLNEWVMGENGPELEWEKLLNGAGGIVEEVVQPSSTAGMSGTAGMAGNHAEVLACIKTAMEENNHLTGGDIFLAEDGTVITGHQDDYGFLQIYAQIPNVKKIAVSGSGESKFSLTKDGNLYYRDTQIADNVKDIAYCTNNVNEKGFYITDEGIYQLETKWPETVPDVMIQQQPDNYIVCDNKIISQYEESNYFKNFASKDTMEGKTAISIENDLQDFAAVTSEGRVYLGRDDEIYEGMEWSSWENMIYVDIAKHMKRGSSYGEEAESITVAGLQPDGTVMACGTYAEDILSWGKLAYISMSDGMIVGLTPEGTLKITGEFAEILRPEVESWTNLVTVMAGRSNFWSGIVTAMDAEGTFYYADWGFGQELHANKVSPSNGSDSQSYYKYMTDGSVYNSTPEGWEFWE